MASPEVHYAWLLDLSKRLERKSGHDSIATVESHYPRAESGAIMCAFSEANTGGQHRCRYRRRDPVAMWMHVHFTGHPPSWPGCKTPEAVAAMLDLGVLKAAS